MTAPKIPSWLTAPEKVKGLPASRHPSWHHGALDLDYVVFEQKLNEALHALDEKTRELEESIQTSARLASERACEMLRAEKAEAALAKAEERGIRLGFEAAREITENPLDERDCWDTYDSADDFIAQRRGGG